MKSFFTPAQRRKFLWCAAGLSVSVLPALAQDDFTTPWQVRLSANTMLNVTTRFQGHPGQPLVSYDNGYVGTDVSGDPNLSTYWGYNQSSQQILSGGNVTGLNYERTTPLANQSSPRGEAGPSAGGEITLRRQLGEWREIRYGLELGAGYNKVHVQADSSYVAPGRRTDYSHGLITPMDPVLIPPGYQGPYEGAGPNINPTPTVGQTSIIPNAVQISGSREVDADVFGLRFGPYLELPLTQKLSASVSVGGMLALVRDQVSWTEQIIVNTALNGDRTGQSSVSGDSCGVTAGFYAGADLNYLLTKQWTLFVGARFQNAGTYTHSIGQGQMDLNLGKTFSVELGVGYSF